MGESIANFDTEFRLEIARAHVAELCLQDQLADHPLLVRGSEAAIDGQLSIVEPADVRLEVVLVLEMCTANVGKGRNAQTDEVRTGPELVPVDEFCLFRIL